MAEVKQILQVNEDLTKKLFGNYDENIRAIEHYSLVKVALHKDGLSLRGEEADCAKAKQLIGHLLIKLSDGGDIGRTDIRVASEMINENKSDELGEMSRDTVAVSAKGKRIICKTTGQRDYVKAIRKNTVVFGIGPAGTGKTYLAVALAVSAYKAGETEKIILTRPAIEAGEKLGFLPGDLQTKVDPYLRPLYDALEEMFGVDRYQKLLERGAIEIAPLAYMRGRTLSNAFIILDEAQNTTREQMQMFLTRLGFGSKMVITGDLTQTDLPIGKMSGLKQAAELLTDIPDIQICTLTEKDVVRHELVQKIVQAYAKGGHNDSAR